MFLSVDAPGKVSLGNASIATVDSHGKVWDVGTGKCTITTTCCGKDSLGNDIQVYTLTTVIANGNSDSTDSKKLQRNV